MHWIGEESFHGSTLADWFGLVLLEKLIKRRILFALGQHLQAVVMIAYILVVDT